MVQSTKSASRNSFSNKAPDLQEFAEKVVEINRTSKKTKGGNRLSFSALMVVGNKKGQVGAGLGKAGDVRSAIEKAKRKAKKSLVEVSVVGEAKTVSFTMYLKKKAAKILLKPAPAGTGIKAGGSMRAVLEVAGYKNVVGKILGSNNKKQNVYTTLTVLKKIRRLSLRRKKAQ